MTPTDGRQPAETCTPNLKSAMCSSAGGTGGAAPQSPTCANLCRWCPACSNSSARSSPPPQAAAAPASSTRGRAQATEHTKHSQQQRISSRECKRADTQACMRACEAVQLKEGCSSKPSVPTTNQIPTTAAVFNIEPHKDAHDTHHT
jgi:hypothetical protein